MRPKKVKPEFHIVTTFYVHYDETGKVRLLSNEMNKQYKIFEIDVFLIEDFLTGKKDHNGYDIEYFFNLSKGIATAENDAVEYSKPLFQLIEHNDDHGDIVLEHDSKNKQWIIYASDEAAEKLEVLPALNFYVCKKNNPHFLYRSFTVDSELLREGPVVTVFQTDIESDLDNISVATLKRFKDYNIRVAQ